MCCDDFVDTSPQFENQVLTTPENSNISIELKVSALNKRRSPAEVSIMIVKGILKQIYLKFCFKCVFLLVIIS